MISCCQPQLKSVEQSIYNPVLGDHVTINSGSYGDTVSTLPLSLRQKDGVVERHQIEGNDPSDRYFSRAILVSRVAHGYLAKLNYEALAVQGQTYPTIAAAVSSAVDKLREFGFRRMRTRPNFKGRRYLAEKETWVEYPDP
jgi:hypothetical protein